MPWPWQRQRELPAVPPVTQTIERRWMLPRTLIIALSIIATIAVLILLNQVATFVTSLTGSSLLGGLAGAAVGAVLIVPDAPQGAHSESQPREGDDCRS